MGQLTSSKSTVVPQQEASNVLVGVLDPNEPLSAPIVSSYNDRIRPLLDAIDRLRELMVMEEGIQLPTIVVVGDQSSGKSSVLESLAGISLPRGQGICTRVPLIMRLQHHSDPQPVLSLEFSDQVVPTDEDHISEAINEATERIAGNGKGISNNPITLVVKKKGVPDLTMVDLPGITRVPVHGQPDNIYEQTRDIITEYITPEESIILNVLSASVDFTTCESIRMSQSVDKTGERTIAVVTKADRAPEGLLEKVTADDVNIGLGYVCVRNRIGNESYEEARMEEATLFKTHPLLSKIDKSIVGIPVLVKEISGMPIEFVDKLWNYVEEVVMIVLMHHVGDYYQLQLSTRRAANNLIAKMKEKYIKWMEEVVEMEMVTDYTCNPEYISEWNKLMAQQDSFISGAFDENRITSTIKLEGFGDIEVGHLKQYAHLLEQAFDLRMRMTAYWKIDLEFEIVNELFGSNVGGIERFMEELPSIASKRSKLNKSILKLKGCKDVVANIFDRIVAHAD
ncbi:hypothetical protein FEM48_Zijuj01G0053200 [Ziziphus jujuba var. spinosa]|uniref:Dynamin-type G domain-containing protein n=1 Tax=Ziziphus jujuba var. spinosa TaxID=714518 RepID=A0A978VZC6_ZIZJJ|nr:hypothetical protein FEM48_Zijuj01G0053200 [Ziziphus jujuba var. spinosa]